MNDKMIFKLLQWLGLSMTICGTVVTTIVNGKKQEMDIDKACQKYIEKNFKK